MTAETFMESVQWLEAPLPRAARSVKLLRVSPIQPLSGWWVSRQVARMFCHWDGRASWPHLNDSSRCPGCRLGQPLKVKGYALMLLETQPKVRAVELTSGCMDECDLFDGTKYSLRGRYVTLSRRRPKNGKPASKQSPLDATWGPKKHPEPLPADFDFRGSLGLIFGLVPDMNGMTRKVEWEGGTP